MIRLILLLTATVLTLACANPTPVPTSTPAPTHDSRYFVPLLGTTANGFDIEEVSADKRLT